MCSPVIALLFAASFTLAQSSSPQLHNGTIFIASVDHSIRASRAKPGDTVHLKVAQPFLSNGAVVPKGAKIKGHVVVVRNVDKTNNSEALLAIVADNVSWKTRSIKLCAWIVGFGSIKFSKANPYQNERMIFGRRMMDKMTKAADRSDAKYLNAPASPEVFTTFDRDFGSTKYDFARVTRHFRLVRKPQKSIGTILVHDDGDIQLQKDLLVLMEEIDLGDPS